MKVIAVLIVLALGFGARAEDGCDLKQFQSQKFDLQLKDKAFVKKIMVHSYGAETDQYIPQLKSATSGTYTKTTSKYEPLVVYFFTSYRDAATAKRAAEHLKAKWIVNRRGQYDVGIKGNDVLWLANNDVSPACFKKIVATESARFLKK